ncbi:FliA/WhiG family RNA polymerase sigma factor [Anaerobacillus alkaliphilus]|uniref:FliA/WhiG family RNA polymerase sigma factor n=1 Tax=Anaerobacillus alkaliphilus TaxID=1548597 RepID=A0A4V1LFZ5_9BACI|nr:FliA/WhiG family RNA polymerase sigma factor [Anaerobacillus alkaliphilus]RXI97984.1 FliA/WhiG family RNA polymerase sigma factor [Anaerobacillus alkaliphilus]
MPQTKEKEDLIWKKWIEQRDIEACDELIRVYLPLVDYHVQRISVGLPRNVNKEDLKSHALLGLYDALEKFDYTRELKFDTYASFRIRGSIIDGLRQEDWLPRSLRERSKKVEATIEKLEQTNGRYVTAKEVAESLDLTEEDVLQVMTESFVANMLSIDEKPNDSKRDETFKNTLMDKSTLNPEEQMVKKNTQEELVQIIESLNDKEQLVISLFYFEELTLTEIGQIMGLSTSRISQIHSKALFRLKQVFSKGKR